MILSNSKLLLCIKVTFFIVLAFLSFYLLVYTLAHAKILGVDKWNSAIAMIEGTARKPYVFRTLLAQIANIFTVVTPDELLHASSNGVKQFLGSSTYKDFNFVLKLDKINTASLINNAYPIGVVILSMYASLIMYGVGLYKVSRESKYNLYTSYGTAIAGLLLVFPYMDGTAKIYDFPVLAFNIWSIFFLLQRRWWAYIFTFTCACINKESAILLVGLYIFACYKPRSPYFYHFLLLQIVVFTIVIGVLNTVYADNPGSPFFFRGTDVLYRTLTHYSVTHIMVVFMSAWLIIQGWCAASKVVRRGFILFLLADVMVYFLLGAHKEYRVFLDVLPLATLIAGYGLFKPLEQSQHCVDTR